MKRWLHISDLHLGSGGMATTMLRDELPRYLRENGLLCDYIFCTGDIRTANVPANGFTDGMAEYILELCRAVGVPAQNLFIVPGNHDVDRDIAGRPEAIKRLMLNRKAYYRSCDGHIKYDDMTAIMAGESDFTEFLSKILPPERVVLYGRPDAPHFNVETDDFNILHVDTTLTYCKGHDKMDFIVGTEALYNVIRSLDKRKPTILLTHYPFSALTQDEKGVLSTALQSNGVRLWLAGHEHEHQLQKMHYLDSVQAGELKLEDRAKTSVLIGEYDERSGHCSITAHAWYPEGWAPYPLVDKDNEGHHDRYECELLPMEDDGACVEKRMSQEADREYYRRLPSRVEKSLLPSIIDRDEVTSLDALLSDTWHTDTPHIILLADGGMGKTTMLLDYCRGTERAILYIPVGHLAALGIGIEQYCTGKIYGGENARLHANLARKYTKPTLTLFIDGLNEVDADAERKFILEIQRLNLLQGLRILVASRSDFTVRYSMPGYRTVRLRPLEDRQIQAFFSPEEWHAVQNSSSLHRLLQNPMMVTVYKEVCSVMKEFRDVEFLDWILPVKNATDLFHDYYVAQLALMMKRGNVDGRQMLFARICIHDVLPALAYSFEKSYNINQEKQYFRKLLAGLIDEIHIDAEALIPLQEHYRVYSLPELDYFHVFELLTDGLRLLYQDSSTVGFPHQMYRDYLSARWIIMQSYDAGKIGELWNSRSLPFPVMTHVRQGSGRYWKNGLANAVHDAGKELSGASVLVDNLLQCFPADEGCGVPDYSGLDLRGHLLPDNSVSSGSMISLQGSQIDVRTLGLEADDDMQFSYLCMSEDKSLLAAFERRSMSIHIFDLREARCVFINALSRPVLKMEFCNDFLFVASDVIYLFSKVPDWHFVGIIEDYEYGMKTAIVKDGVLYLYHNSRLLKYSLADCSLLELVKGKLWKTPVEGTELSSLFERSSRPVRHANILYSVGDDAFQVISYVDGRLVVMSGEEVIAVLVKGMTLLAGAGISGNGRCAATLGGKIFGNVRKVQIWDLDARRKIMDLTCPEEICSIHLSETGEWLLGEDRTRTWVCCLKSGIAKWYDEHFVSNHMNQILSIGNNVLRKKDGLLYLFNLLTNEEKYIESPIPDPSLVCFLNDGSLAAVNRERSRVWLRSARDSRILTLCPDRSEILSIQAMKNEPFIAVSCLNGIISLYHVGTGQRTRKLPTKSSPRTVVVHPARNLIADTDGRRRLETHNYFTRKNAEGKELGQWFLNPYTPDSFKSEKVLEKRRKRQFPPEPDISGDILDIAFNARNNQLVAILSNGRIMFFTEDYCHYRDSFGIITAFDPGFYNFRDCICDKGLMEVLGRNGVSRF